MNLVLLQYTSRYTFPLAHRARTSIKTIHKSTIITSNAFAKRRERKRKKDCAAEKTSNNAWTNNTALFNDSVNISAFHIPIQRGKRNGSVVVCTISSFFFSFFVAETSMTVIEWAITNFVICGKHSIINQNVSVLLSILHNNLLQMIEWMDV